jgi:hypothetical protein
MDDSEVVVVGAGGPAVPDGTEDESELTTQGELDRPEGPEPEEEPDADQAGEAEAEPDAEEAEPPAPEPSAKAKASTKKS